jgi:hypothetical protein
MTTTNNITGDKIQSKPSTKAWYEAAYWAVLDDKLREKEREAQEALREINNDLDET